MSTAPTMPTITDNTLPEIVRHLEHIGMSLIDLVRSENSFLRESDSRGFQSLQPQKSKLTEEYECTLKAILATEIDLKALSDSGKTRLREMHAEMNTLAEQNLTLLTQTRAVTRRMQQRLLDFMRKTINDEEPVYDASGTLRPVDRKTLSSGFQDNV